MTMIRNLYKKYTDCPVISEAEALLDIIDSQLENFDGGHLVSVYE